MCLTCFGVETIVKSLVKLNTRLTFKCFKHNFRNHDRIIKYVTLFLSLCCTATQQSYILIWNHQNEGDHLLVSLIGRYNFPLLYNIFVNRLWVIFDVSCFKTHYTIWNISVRFLKIGQISVKRKWETFWLVLHFINKKYENIIIVTVYR